MILLISWFKFISVVTRKAKPKEHEAKFKARQLDQNLFLWIVASDADTGALNSDGIKILLAEDLSSFRIKGKPAFFNGPKCLPKNHPDCSILFN